MLKVQEIKELIRAIDQSSIEQFDYKHEGSKISITKKTMAQQHVEQKHESKQEQPVVVGPSASEQKERETAVSTTLSEEPQENTHMVVSPMVGTFYSSAEPGAEPFVKIGEKITEGTVVCIVEAMKLFNEIEAEVNGEVIEVLVEDGQLVEYGQPLLKVKLNEGK
jgi:acetyl-CoA carboxylase biotin carboxyl carrier protein